MKKLFLLLILSFFSVQSFAGSCPDDSDPIKSISADGTYFVYNCGVTPTKNKHHGVEHKLNTDPDDWHKFDTSITVGYTSSPPTQTYSYSSFDNIVDPYGRIISSLEIPDRWTNLKTPLMDIKVPENWKLIDNYVRYQNIISRNANPRGVGHANNPLKSECIEMFHNFEKVASSNRADWYDKTLQFKDCLFDLRYRLYEGDKLDGIKWTNGKEYVLEVFEYWAKQGLDQPKDAEIGSKDYDYFRALAFLAGVYAQEKDNIEFSDTFTAWLTDRLLNVEFRSFETTNNTIYPRCRQNDFFTWGNDCSTPRFILTEAQLVGGLALGNQEIFDEGIDSLQYITTFFDDKNIFIRNASRGPKAMMYHVWIPTYLTNYAVVLDSVGYDFLEHKMPNGSKVHEAIKFSFDHVWEDDLSIFWPYIQINAGAGDDCCYSELLKPMHLRQGYSGFLPSKPQRIVRQSLFYVDKYQPELKDTFGYEEVYSKFVKGTRDFSLAYKGKSGNYAMFDIDSPLDMHSIYKASDKVFFSEENIEARRIAQEALDKEIAELEAQLAAEEEAIEKEIAELEAQLAAEEEAIEKEIAELEAQIAAEEEACKVSVLNGEYIATWFFANVNNNQAPDLQGSESLFLNECVGEFEGVESFQPAKELRKKLQVNYKTNGQITISGHIDLWDVGRSYHTVLKGDLNSGVISGVWEEGDLIKIEITKVNN